MLARIQFTLVYSDTTESKKTKGVCVTVQSQAISTLIIFGDYISSNNHPIEKIPETETDTSCSPAIIGVEDEAVPP